MTLKTYTFAPASNRPPKKVVFLLHGLGADGRDLIGLAPMFAPSLPDTIFLSPDAPYPCDMAPIGRQWFSLREWAPESILRGVQDASPVLDAYITAQLEHLNLTDADCALVGFSQGTMMSLYTGPRRKNRIAGILAYSGALVQEDSVDPATLQKPPVCLIHGMADPVVPVTAYYHAKNALERAGFAVSGGVTPGLMHAIDPGGIQSGIKFLKEICCF